MIENPDGSVPPPAPSGGFVLPEDQKEVGTVQLYNYCPAILLYYCTTVLSTVPAPHSSTRSRVTLGTREFLGRLGSILTTGRKVFSHSVTSVLAN